jgi:hypothetical protein
MKEEDPSMLVVEKDAPDQDDVERLREARKWEEKGP